MYTVYFPGDLLKTIKLQSIEQHLGSIVLDFHTFLSFQNFFLRTSHSLGRLVSTTPSL